MASGGAVVVQSSSGELCDFLSDDAPHVTIARRETDIEDRICRACGVPNTLYTDWAQGDRVCTHCGVVDEQRLRDDSPEWKDFNEAEDIVRGNVAGRARCGLLPTDESKYWGGLQPTSLSKHSFGNKRHEAFRSRRRTLMIAKHRIERSIRKEQMNTLQSSQWDMAIQRKRLRERGADDGPPPEVEEIESLVDDEDKYYQAAVNANKWSLDRAIRLFGDENERKVGGSESDLHETMGDTIDKKSEEALNQSAQDLYNAYSILAAAARRLHLPEPVLREAVRMLCRYAQSRDGLSVRGIASSLQRKQKHRQQTNPRAERAAKQTLREYNKLKQVGALSAALLFWIARSENHARPLVEVCNSIRPTASLSKSPHLDLGKDQVFIKRKHCSRAMAEIKQTLPDFDVVGLGTENEQGEKQTSSAISTIIEYPIRKLGLPPVADATLRCLVLAWFKRMESENKEGVNCDSRFPRQVCTVCGALAYLVCSAGNVMQTLAQQRKKRPRIAAGAGALMAKRSKANSPSTSSATPGSSSDVLVPPARQEVADGFSCDELIEFQTEQHEYEMHTMWSVWSEQLPWLRTLDQIEKCFGIPKSAIVQNYQRKVHPVRQRWLEFLRDATAGKGVDDEATAFDKDHVQIFLGTPTTSILLSHIPTAAPLIKLPTLKR